MASIIFLPGILGSRLFLDGEEVWPPTPLEAQFGYDRINKLLDPKVQAGNPIDAVLCFDIYAQLLDDLTEIASGQFGAPARSFHPFGYDWRVDLRTAADTIVARIDALPAADLNEIILVGHSMGCLVTRLILESGSYSNRPWLKNVRTFVALAGPHRGAPTALVRAIGLEGTSGLAPADIKMMAADPRYPSLYQLLPAPGIAAAWDIRGRGMTELDLYDAAVAKILGLDQRNLKKAKEVHAILAKDKRPPHVEYIYLAGSGKDTWLRIDVSGTRFSGSSGTDAGDGTVPLWSAVDPSRVHHAAPAAHQSVFKNEEIRNLIYRSMGASLPALAFSATGDPVIQIFAAETVYAEGQQVDLTIVPVNPTSKIEGEIILEFTDVVSPPAFAPVDRIPLVYDGAPVEKLDVLLAAPRRPGFYRVIFAGSHAIVPGQEPLFAISAAGGGAGP